MSALLDQGPPFLDAAAVRGLFGWEDAVAALAAGCAGVRAILEDVVVDGPASGPPGGRVLNRTAWVPGVGVGAKIVTIFPANADAAPPRPTVHGLFVLFDEMTGEVRASVDGALLTHWKTAADSVLGARRLARPNPRTLVIIGSGVLAASLIEAYAACFPSLERIDVLARSPAKADALIARVAALRPGPQPILRRADDRAATLAAADIIATATSSKTPVLQGAEVPDGAHVDLIGAFAADMREADDALIKRARLFVDCFDTTLNHIGELKTPLATGVIERADVLGDFYDLGAGRRTDNDVTVVKNGGGAHFDVMIAELMHRRWRGRTG